MRVTISLNDEVGNFANQLAAERNVSRSQLIAELIEEQRRRLLEEKLSEGYIARREEHLRFAETAVGISAEIWPPY